jgi:formate/nitrite transporter FocA (FNT family)
LRVPQVRLRAERKEAEAAELRIWWLSFFAGMVITLPFHLQDL